MNERILQSAIATVVCVLSGAAPAGAAVRDPVPDTVDMPVGLPELLSLGGSLLMVVAAVVVVGWLYSKSQGVRGTANDAISIVASQALGPKERILLIEVGGKQIVLGMTAQQVQTLHVFDDVVVARREQPAGNSAFADRLRSAIRGVAR